MRFLLVNDQSQFFNGFDLSSLEVPNCDLANLKLILFAKKKAELFGKHISKQVYSLSFHFQFSEPN